MIFLAPPYQAAEQVMKAHSTFLMCFQLFRPIASRGGGRLCLLSLCDDSGDEASGPTFSHPSTRPYGGCH